MHEKSASLQETARVRTVERFRSDAVDELKECSTHIGRHLVEEDTELVVRAERPAGQISGTNQQAITSWALREQCLRVEEAGLLQYDSNREPSSLRRLESQQRLKNRRRVETLPIDRQHNAPLSAAVEHSTYRGCDHLHASDGREPGDQDEGRCVSERIDHLARVAGAGRTHDADGCHGIMVRGSATALLRFVPARS